MTRINTNVSALRGLQSVQKANSNLGVSLQRLSTGLQINSGKDNPSGLIASETLRSQVTAIQQSITNSNRANNVISTADAALGEIHGLLNQIRGLVQEGLNNGALSQNEIDANQLQIDAALNAINRISGNTSFAGDKLIDGSKAFNTTLTSADAAKLSDFQINEALFGSSSTVVVDATITTAASKGTLVYKGGDLTAATNIQISGAKGSQVLFFGASSSLSDITNAINKTTDITGVSASSAAGTNASASLAGPTTQTYDNLTIAAASAGTAGNSTSVTFGTANDTTTTVSVSGSAITVNLGVSTGVAATASLNGPSTQTYDDLSFQAASVGTAGNNTTVTFGTASNTTTTVSVSGSAITVNLGVSTGVQSTLSSDGPTTQTYDNLSFTAVNAGTAGDNITVTYTQATDATTAVSVSGNAITIAVGYDTTGSVLVGTASEAAAAIAANTSAAALVTASAGGSGTGVLGTAAATNLAGGAASGAVVATASAAAAAIAANTSAAALVSVTAGGSGTGVFGTVAATNLSGGAASGAVVATASQAAAAIAANTSAAALVTVTAGGSGTGTFGTVASTSLTGGAASQITLSSSNFGSSEFVDVNVLSGAFATVDTSDTATYRDIGSDIVANINGQLATGEGLRASISTQTLNASVVFASASNIATTNAKVTITGGGSLFQIGQDVSANGQIGIGIEAVNTAKLGGTTGKLYELGSGAGKSLNDVGPTVQGSALVDIVSEAIDRVSTLRGRLGALQKNVIETNISSLGVALENISAARSQIVDTDFAAETSNLTKNQILSQSSLTVLGIANQQPNQVLSLLRQ